MPKQGTIMDEDEDDELEETLEIVFDPEFEIPDDGIVFMPGCFDYFEGTQEELDELISILKTKILSRNSADIDEDFVIVGSKKDRNLQ